MLKVDETKLDRKPEQRRKDRGGGMPKLGGQEKHDIARALGQAYFRRLLIQNNPNLTRIELKTQIQTVWAGSRREYTRLGLQVLKQLEAMGYSVTKDPKKAGNAKVSDDVSDDISP